MKKTFAALGVILALTACSAEPAPPMAVKQVLPPKMSVNVQAINLADRSGIQPANSPYKTNKFSPTISESIKQWASDRLQAVGTSGQAVIIIKEASLTEQKVPTKEGFEGWFTREQGVKYIGRAEVTVEAHSPQGYAVTDASASRTVSLPENPNPMERQEAYYNLINGLMTDLGKNLDSGIQTHMGNFIVRSPIYGGKAIPVGQPEMPRSDSQMPPMTDDMPVQLAPAP